MSYLTTEVINRGFKYYDWNISSGDATYGEKTSTDIYNAVVNSLRKDKVNMVLMHDIKTYTRDALRDIIKYGKENGYTFEKITDDTEMITQRVNN
jgi:peptidoglycan/xylan/chitin deacetylase (PgdA/CDA1 family)